MVRASDHGLGVKSAATVVRSQIVLALRRHKVGACSAVEVPLSQRHQTAMRLDHVGVWGDTYRVRVDQFGRVKRFVIGGDGWFLSIPSILEVVSILSLDQVLFK